MFAGVLEVFNTNLEDLGEVVRGFVLDSFCYRFCLNRDFFYIALHILDSCNFHCELWVNIIACVGFCCVSLRVLHGVV